MRAASTSCVCKLPDAVSRPRSKAATGGSIPSANNVATRIADGAIVAVEYFGAMNLLLQFEGIGRGRRELERDAVVTRGGISGAHPSDSSEQRADNGGECGVAAECATVFARCEQGSETQY